MKNREKMNLILGLPKSLYWNIKLFGVKKGGKLPLLFGWKCKVDISMGTIELPNRVSFGMIKIGINYGPFNKGKGQESLFLIKKDAKVIFKGKCNVNEGGIVNITSGVCKIGNNFAANASFLLSCEKSVIIGDNVLFGWECTIIDGDGHEIIENVTEKIVNNACAVTIGNHVWGAARVSILKGSVIADDSIIGYGCITSRAYREKGIVVVGQPSRIVKEDVTWKR